MVSGFSVLLDRRPLVESVRRVEAALRPVLLVAEVLLFRLPMLGVLLPLLDLLPPADAAELV